MAENRHIRSQLIEDTAPDLPLETLYSINARVESSLIFEEHVSLKGLGALAVRAAELGDMVLALSFLDRKGNSTFNGDRTLQDVYQLAPRSWINELIERAQELPPAVRSVALAELVNRVPRRRRRALVESIVESAASLRYAQNERRLDVIRMIEPELRRLPTSALVSIWTAAMRHSMEQGREEILVDVRAFAPTLISRLGPEIALKLDEAICLGGGDVWP